MSYPSYLDVRDQNRVFADVAAYGIRQFKLSDPGDLELIWGEAVSANYFSLLGVPAHAGQLFTKAAGNERVPGSYPAIVISHGLWKRRFNSDPSLIGKTVRINNQPLTVIGVAAGVAGAAALSRYLESLLYGLTPLDVTTFVAVVVMFAAVATLASYVPARRATRVDPLVALRTE